MTTLITQIDKLFTKYTRKQIMGRIQLAMQSGDSEVYYHFQSPITRKDSSRYTRLWVLYHAMFADELRKQGYQVSITHYDSLLIRLPDKAYDKQ